MSVIIENLIENGFKEKYISEKKNFLMILSANLRPLYNSNVAKVSVVKWSQNLIFVDANAFFGLPYDCQITFKSQFCKYLAMPEMTLRTKKIQF